MNSADSAANCPVCGSVEVYGFAQARDVEYYTSDHLYSYFQCGVCGSVYLENPPADRLSEIYPPNYYSYQSKGSSKSFIESAKEFLDTRLFRRLLTGIPGESLSILDVGRGAGWLLSTARKASARVRKTHELDIDETARAAAESAGHVFHCSRVEDFSFAERFDLILMLNLIEHVADPASVIVAMRKLLAPRGLLLIKTPNVDTLDCRIFRDHNWGGFHCPRHFVLFNRKSIEDLGQKCGLEVQSAFYTQGAPQWACSILGWLGLKGRLRISAVRPLYTHPLYPLVCALAAVFDLVRSPFMTTAQMFVVFRLPECADNDFNRD